IGMPGLGERNLDARNLGARTELSGAADEKEERQGAPGAHRARTRELPALPGFAAPDGRGRTGARRQGSAAGAFASMPRTAISHDMMDLIAGETHVLQRPIVESLQGGHGTA